MEMFNPKIALLPLLNVVSTINEIIKIKLWPIIYGGTGEPKMNMFGFGAFQTKMPSLFDLCPYLFHDVTLY